MRIILDDVFRCHGQRLALNVVFLSLLESFRSAYTLNVDVINHHMTLSTGNVHGEILTFYKPGTMFHCKRILMGSFFVRRFLFNVSGVSRFSLISLVSEYEG